MPEKEILVEDVICDTMAKSYFPHDTTKTNSICTGCVPKMLE
jgi:hypothetical protein